MRRIMQTTDRPQIESNDYRRKRTYMTAPRGVHQTIMRAEAYKPQSGALDKYQTSWIGKRLIYSGQTPGPTETEYVYESNIARYALPYSYRIIYINSDTVDIENLMFYDDKYIREILPARSVFTVEYRPARMNILVDLKNIIRDIRYF